MPIMLSRKRIVACGVIALAVAALALGGGTFAFFSSRQAGSGGTLAAGTLKLDVGGAATTRLFNSGIDPGKTILKSVTIYNRGSLPGRLTEEYLLTGDENGCTTPETAAGGCTTTGDGNLADPDQLQVSLDNVHYGSVSEMTNTDWMPPTVLGPGQSVQQNFWFRLPSNSSNNKAQSDQLIIQSTVRLTQT